MSHRGSRLACPWSESEGSHEKRPAIGLLLDELRGGCAGAVSGSRFHANEHGRVARLRCLKGRRKLEAVRRNDAVVVIGGGHECGRVARAGPDGVERRVREERAELRRGWEGSVPAPPAPPNGAPVVP